MIAPTTDGPVLVSACLLGVACRYDGASKPAPGQPLASDGGVLIPVCPEVMAGMPVPRPAIERRDDGRVVRVHDGADVTEALDAAADAILAIAEREGARHAVLKEYSPSCGVSALKRRGQVVPGRGRVAERLAAAGLTVTSELSRAGVEGR